MLDRSRFIPEPHEVLHDLESRLGTPVRSAHPPRTSMTPTELTQGENCGTLYPRIVQESVRTSRREAQENVHVTTEVDLVVGQTAFLVDRPECADAVDNEGVGFYGSLEALQAIPCAVLVSANPHYGSRDGRTSHVLEDDACALRDEDVVREAVYDHSPNAFLDDGRQDCERGRK